MSIDEAIDFVDDILSTVSWNEEQKDQEDFFNNVSDWLEELKAMRNLDKTNFSDGYEKGRADAIEELKDKKDEIIRWLIKRDKEGYGTTNGELLDYVLKIAEQLNDNK